MQKDTTSHNLLVQSLYLFLNYSKVQGLPSNTNSKELVAKYVLIQSVTLLAGRISRLIN